MPNAVHLNHRAVIAVTGSDAETFLTGLITNSVSGLDANASRYAALLTPQGKVIADFLVFRNADGFLFDCAKDAREDLVRRLSMYKLRSKVGVAARDDIAVLAFSGSPDPRSDAAPARSLAPRSEAPSEGSLADYHSARIGAGLAEQSIDFASGEVFPADINMDALSGVDFAKGCFVGQEVVSRMKRRGTARRRTLTVKFDSEAPPSPAPVLAGEFEIGQLTSTADDIGLARVRIDQLAKALADGEAITVDGQTCQPVWPDWLPKPES